MDSVTLLLRYRFRITAYAFLCFFFVFYRIHLAHPVTYKGGHAFSLLKTDLYTNLYINKSTSQNRSFGLQFLSLSNQRDFFSFIQFNALFKRWHFYDAQANLYTTFSLGFNPNNTRIFPCLHLKGDAENRRYYLDFSFTIMHPSSYLVTHATSRVGWSPYKHRFSTISTWFMLETMYLNYHHSQIVFMPLYRGFYKSFLWEIGYNGTNSLGQVMVHF